MKLHTLKNTNGSIFEKHQTKVNCGTQGSTNLDNQENNLKI